jgi:hypothetical protein
LLALGLAFLAINVAVAVDFEPGEHVLKETLIVANTAGNRITGKAASQMVNQGSRGADGTWLAWGGPQPGPVLRLLGSDTVLEHISIHGATRAAARGGAATPDIGVLVQRAGKGLPTGRIKALDVNIAYAKTGLQIGVRPNDEQCAECEWRSMWFDNCSTAIRIVPAMALGHYFNMVRANGCDTIFLIEGGGKLLVDGLFTATANTTLVKFRPLRGGVGHNNASYEFRHIFLDRQAKSAVICDMADWNYGGSIVFSGGKITYKGDRQADRSTTGYGGAAFKLGGNASVTVRDYEHLQPGMIEWSNRRFVTRLLIENSCIMGDAASLFNAVNSTGDLRVLLRDCYQPDGAPIPDFDQTLRGTNAMPPPQKS